MRKESDIIELTSNYTMDLVFFSKPFYVNFPAAVAEAGNIEKGEEMEWCIQDKDTYILKRVNKSKLPAVEKEKE
jgi:hypothetical protein